MRIQTAAAVCALLFAGAAIAPVRGAEPTPLPRAGRTVRIPAGSYRPFYRNTPPRSGGDAAARVPVAAFDLDRRAVTNAEFLAFVRLHPEWRRSRVKAIVADTGYLQRWAGDLELGDQAPPGAPVVNVSWFAARAYLHAVGKELPTTDQWEYAAAASAVRRDASRDPAFLAQLRQWYGRPVPDTLPAAGRGRANVYGVSGLHGLIWEWVLDFNSLLVTGDSRGDGGGDLTMFCGAGALGAADFADYAAFMRYAFRSSLEARYTVANLGFRGVALKRETR